MSSINWLIDYENSALNGIIDEVDYDQHNDEEDGDDDEDGDGDAHDEDDGI